MNNPRFPFAAKTIYTHLNLLCPTLIILSLWCFFCVSGVLLAVACKSVSTFLFVSLLFSYGLVLSLYAAAYYTCKLAVKVVDFRKTRARDLIPSKSELVSLSGLSFLFYVFTLLSLPTLILPPIGGLVFYFTPYFVGPKKNFFTVLRESASFVKENPVNCLMLYAVFLSSLIVSSAGLFLPVFLLMPWVYVATSLYVRGV
ncbi:MAG: hypothetical protein GF334_09025 [Candidatus Altiarchaeales archaeon]|nr:hypothetical protein [Candidatus Altiarchaeales archaeon]